MTENKAEKHLKYTYDNIYEINEVYRLSPEPTATLETFSYDGVGNRTTDSDYSNYAYNTNNQLTSYDSITFNYDKNGNLTKKTQNGTDETVYTFDYENKITRIDYPDETYSAYKYDAMGRRIEKRDRNANISRYVYDGQNFVAEYDGSNVLLASYVQGLEIDRPISMYRGGGMYWYHSDALGSIYQMTDSNETVARSYDYSAFGKIISESGPFANTFTYTARERDEDSGLYYYRARYYDATVGRFMSRDPLNGAHSLPPEHLYLFARNDPVNRIDPMGLWTRCKDLGAGVSGCCTCGYAYLCLSPQDATIVPVTSGRPWFRITGCTCDCVYSAPYFGTFTRSGACSLAIPA